MRYVLICLISATLILGATAVPVRANGSETGRTFAVSVTGFPDSVVAGDVMNGVVSITIFGPGSPVRVPVRYAIYSTSAIGDGHVSSGEFAMRSGRTRTMHIEIPVDPEARAGQFDFKLVVTVGNESLSLGHTLTVLPQ